MTTWSNYTVEEIETEIVRRQELYEGYKKDFQKDLEALSRIAQNMDAKEAKRKLNDLKSLVDVIEMCKENLGVAEDAKLEKIKFLESQKDEYQPLRDFVEVWKEKELSWYQNKLDTGDRTKCTKQDKIMLDEGIEYIQAVLEADSQYRLHDLIYRLKDAVGTVQSCSLRRNPNDGFDGVISGSEGKVRLETILAGGYNIQKLHYRTLMNKC